MGTTHKNFLSVRRRAARDVRRKLAFQLLLLYVGMKSKVMFEQWITRELSWPMKGGCRTIRSNS